MTMNRDEIEAWDARKGEELEREMDNERRCRACKKAPPTKERIEEVSTAVLHRRVQAALDELRRRRGG